MTTEEALKVVDDRARYSMADVAREALRTLADALREAQSAVVQMREDAARVCDEEAADASATLATFEFGTTGHSRHGARMTTSDSLAARIRALPAPAARTYEDVRREGVQAAFDAVHRVSALPYTDSPRSAFDAARIMREACQDAVQALLSPAPAVAPVAGWRNLADGTVASGPNMPSFTPTTVKAFDAEAALVAMRDHLFVKNAAVFPTPEADHVLFYALDAGLAAGRGAR